MKKLIFISILILILSCDSDDENELTNFKLIKIESFDSNNNLNGTTIFEYDDELRLILQKDGSGNIIYSYTYENDKINAIISNVSTTNYIYNGNLIISSSRIQNDTLMSSEYQYNTLEQLINSKNYEDGILQCETNFTYDSNDNIETSINSCTNLERSFEYDNMRNQNSLLFNSGLLKVFGMGYNNNITKTFDGDSNVLQETTYEYNNQGYPNISVVSFLNTSFRNEYTYKNL